MPVRPVSGSTKNDLEECLADLIGELESEAKQLDEFKAEILRHIAKAREALAKMRTLN